MSMDNYIGIIRCKDGKWRGFDLSASQDIPTKEELIKRWVDDEIKPCLEESFALDVIKTAQTIPTEYGYQFIDQKDLEMDGYKLSFDSQKIIPLEKEKFYGHPRFYELLKEIKELHSKKNYNYATDKNPLSNFYECEKFGIPAPYGCLVRMTDKDCRRIEVLLKGDVVGETIIDTSKDDAVYSLIFTILFEDFLKNKNAEEIMKKFKEIKKLLEEGRND